MFLGDKLKGHSTTDIQNAIANAIGALIGEEVTCNIQDVSYQGGMGHVVINLRLDEPNLWDLEADTSDGEGTA